MNKTPIIKTITKEKIANELKATIGLSGLICEKIVNRIFEEIYEIVKLEQKLTLKNFGSFCVNSKKARPGQNLQTKKPIIIQPRKVMRFLPAKALKTKVNKI